jgi:hypothetical protein
VAGFSKSFMTLSLRYLLLSDVVKNSDLRNE